MSPDRAEREARLMAETLASRRVLLAARLQRQLGQQAHQEAHERIREAVRRAR